VLHNAVISVQARHGPIPDRRGRPDGTGRTATDVTGWNTGGYLETTSLPKDAWGNDFVYQLSPDSGKPFVIISYGADGEEGGEKLDADLYSTDTD